MDQDREAWLAAHKGPLRRVVGYVWWCGDEDYCNCSQAVVEEEYENKVDQRFIVPVRVWEGEYHTDGEGDPYGELSAERERLQREDPEREALIQWQVPSDAPSSPATQRAE